MKCTNEYFGHITDGPNTTFLPDTLEKILKEKNIDKELINQIMATINSQTWVSYNTGYIDGKKRWKETN